MKVRIRKQEFPYDIGILSNIKAGMGGSWNVFPPYIPNNGSWLTDMITIKVLSWFWPLASTPDRKSGLEFEVNEFEGTSPPIHENHCYNANTV